MSLKILDSIGGSQRFSVEKSFVHFCISDKSFFLASSTARSSINASYSNQGVDPSGCGGIFVVIPVPAVH